jgi:hypothetical protein
LKLQKEGRKRCTKCDENAKELRRKPGHQMQL